jgi:hypothetical protein
MRILRALGDFISDLLQGDVVALSLAGFFLLLVIGAGTIWVIDRRRRAKEKAKTMRAKEKLTGRDRRSITKPK